MSGPDELDLDALLQDAVDLAEQDIAERGEPHRGADDAGEEWSEAALGQLAADTHALFEADMERRFASGLPAPPPLPRVSGRSGTRWPLVFIAAAALLVASFGLLRGVVALQEDDAANGQSAQRMHVDTGGEQEIAEARTPEPAKKRQVVPKLEPAVEPEAEDEPEPAVEVAPETMPTKAPSKARETVPMKERLAALDAEAQAQWRAGDRRAAAKTFRRIIRIGGRRLEVQLAYGELFNLLRQLDGAGARDELWREYLRRFPRGRFADDARGGLCRRAKPSKAAACWVAYLEDFPQGAHRTRAEREAAP